MMTTDTQISLLTFLKNPRTGISRLNGWQRIWLVLSGVIFAIHALIGFLILSDLPAMRFDSSKYEEKIAVAEKWKLENRQRCIAVIDELMFASRTNDEYNATNEAKSKELRAATQTKIDEAKARLFAIETSGGKYSEQWAKYDNAITAYDVKLREQKWIPRPFNAEQTVKPESLTAIKECAQFDQQRTDMLSTMDADKITAKNSRQRAVDNLLATAISFVCFALGLYLIGWCIGWIKGGFSPKR